MSAVGTAEDPPEFIGQEPSAVPPGLRCLIRATPAINCWATVVLSLRDKETTPLVQVHNLTTINPLKRSSLNSPATVGCDSRLNSSALTRQCQNAIAHPVADARGAVTYGRLTVPQAV